LCEHSFDFEHIVGIHRQWRTTIIMVDFMLTVTAQGTLKQGRRHEFEGGNALEDRFSAQS